MTDHEPRPDDDSTPDVIYTPRGPVPGLDDDADGIAAERRFQAARAATAGWLVHALNRDAAGQADAWASLLDACDELIPANLFARQVADLLPMCAAGAETVPDLVAHLREVILDARAADDDGPGIL